LPRAWLKIVHDMLFNICRSRPVAKDLSLQDSECG
jgi:hypothetical protein